MYSDENKATALARMLASFSYTLLDTSSLMEDSFPIWMDRLALAKNYLEESHKIYVPSECIDELRRHKKNRGDFEKRIAAIRALKIVRMAKHKKEIEILKKIQKNDYSFADNVIFVKVSQDRLSKRILVITQDKKLATDIKALNDLLSQRGRPVVVDKLNPQGELVANKGEDFSRDARVNNKPQEQRRPLSPAAHQQGRGQTVNKSTLAQTKPKQNPQQKVEHLPNQQPISQKIEPKPKAAEEKPVQKDLWYGVGSNLRSALLNCAEHYGILFRYPSIPYVAQVHGPLDVTEADLDAFVRGLEPQFASSKKASFLYKGITVTGETQQNGYRAWIDFATKIAAAEKPVSSETKVTEKTLSSEAKTPDKFLSRAPKTTARTPQEPAESPKSEKPKQATSKPKKSASQTKEASKPTSVSKKTLKAKDDAVQEGTLVVLKPGTKKEQEAIEFKVRKQTQLSPKVVKAPQKGKTESKPKAKQSIKPKANGKVAESTEQPKPQKPTPDVKKAKPQKPASSSTPAKVSSKKEIKPEVSKAKKGKETAAKQQTSKPKAEPKKEAKKPTASKQDKAFEEALKNERILLADFANPKALASRKKADLNRQIQLVQGLPDKQVKRLHRSLAELKTMLAELK